VAFLGNAKSGLELGTVSAGSNHATALDHGSPFYFSWSPDGKQLLAHIGGALDDVSLADGSHVPVAVPGQFEAPFWGSNSQMFIARQAAGCGGACLVTQSGSSVTAQMIAPVPESGADFSPNAAFDAVAIGTRAPTTQGTLGGSLEVARRNGSRWATTQITDQPPVVFYWSPDGSKLLFATLEQASSGPWLHWNVWDGSHTVTYGRFRPGEVFARSYLPFFTQYAQSMSLWAPDGSAFAYPGIDESGQPGIWVQPADDSSAAPTMVSSGDVVTWSPK
jgi:TolB protein